MTNPADCGHGAIISGRALALVLTPATLRRARVAYRANRDVYEELLSLSAVVLGADTGTGVAIRDAAREAGLMTVTEYAEAAGVKARGVRRACQEGRLPAIKRVVWLIDPGALPLRGIPC